MVERLSASNKDKGLKNIRETGRKRKSSRGALGRGGRQREETEREGGEDKEKMKEVLVFFVPVAMW